MKKSFELELMDTMTLPANRLRDVLDFLSITNRYFGGDAVVLKHLDRWSQSWNKNETISILDVGTGGADTPIAIHRWAARKGFSVQITGIDVIPEIVSLAIEKTRAIPSIAIRQQDAFDIGAGHYDYVIASLFLHHIVPEKYLEILKLFERISRRGILISDLHRTRLGFAAVSSLSYLLGNHIVRHDGPLSVKRAFTVEELATLAHHVPSAHLKVQRERWHRLSLSGEKNRADLEMVRL